MDDGNWLRRELQEAEREYTALPEVARPVVVRAADATARSTGPEVGNGTEAGQA